MIFHPGKTLVHVSGQCLDGAEAAALVDLAADLTARPGATLAAGFRHAALEKRLAARFSVKHARLVNSGSSANLLALASLGLPPGSEVITVACAFPTTVAPIVQLGLVPVFVDVGPDGNVDVSQLAAAASPHTRAVMLAHALGFPFDVDAVMRFCEDFGVPYVADCCDAAGAQWRGVEVTALADVSTLSFYPAHHMTTGEGGCVLTDSDRLAAVVTSLRDWGRDCHCAPGCDNTCGERFSQSREVLGDLPDGYDHKYVYSRLGYNLKMTEMQAAIGLVQLQKLDGFVARRRDTWSFYREALADLEGLLAFPQLDDAKDEPPQRGSPFGFLMLSPERERIVAALEAARIQTRPLFAGNLLRHPAMRGVEWRGRGDLPETDRLAREAFWIGVYPGVTDEMREHVVKTLREVCR